MTQSAISDRDIESALSAEVGQAFEDTTPLRITGGNSKAFYGNPVEAQTLDLASHSGVIDYDPAELVISLRAGTRLDHLEALLAENNQMLGFEPLQLGESATIGGVVASGLAGPRRSYAGGVRDFILGVKLLSGRGEVLNFGGRVIKNVAGFDVSRLMVGALGCFGAILEVSLRVIPRFETETTLGFDQADAGSHIRWINQLGSKPLPLSASCWYQGRGYLRLSGSAQGVDSAASKIGGEIETDIWQSLREQNHEAFGSHEKIFRVSLPPTSEDAFEGSPQLIEWGGAQRWLAGDYDATELRQKAEAAGGRVVAYRSPARTGEMFHPLGESMLALHRSLKSSFDPARIMNPGRLYREL